jgi:NAD(P)H-hydrate epimerase
MRVLSAAQMREADRRTIEDIGVPSAVLMENAGRQVVAAMDSTFEGLSAMRIAVLCGAGNNGGDGFVVARVLAGRGQSVTPVLVGASARVQGDARRNLEALRALGVDVVEIDDAAAWELHGADILSADLIVDALVGTGLTRPLSGLIETIVDDLNDKPTPVVSIDVPSGLGADSPETIGPVVRAALTVTLAAPKVALVVPPGEDVAGTLAVADIGVPASVVDTLEGPRIELVTRDMARAIVPARARDSHKGDYGHVLVVAGSPGRTGAAALAAFGALRSGAGLVTVASGAASVPIIAALGAEYMTIALPTEGDATVGLAALAAILEVDADAIVVGPGLGRSPSTQAFVHALVEQAAVPIVIDADALTAFAGSADRLVAREEQDLIITPHPGEMARLTGLSIEEVQTHRIAVARDFASTHRLHVVLKGHRTIIATPEGGVFINLTGNPGMATAGSGDVLAGAVAAWAAQLLDVEAACTLGVYLHGLAGDLAEAEDGQVGLIAGDIAARLGDAVVELMSPRRKGAADPD